jgi:hypothetical protein
MDGSWKDYSGKKITGSFTSTHGWKDGGIVGLMNIIGIDLCGSTNINETALAWFRGILGGQGPFNYALPFSLSLSAVL